MNKYTYIALIVVIIIVWACNGMYKSLDEKLYPAPRINKDARIAVQKSGDLTFITWVEDVQVALIYYYCRFPDGWRIDPVVYDVYPDDNIIRHSRPNNCRSSLRVVVRAFNRFQKPSEKWVQRGWEFKLKPVTDTALRI